MGGGMNISTEIMAKANRVAFKVGMLARKLGVPTLYNIGADVIGVAGKLLFNGYKVGGVRREIDQALRWQVGYQSVVHGQRQHSEDTIPTKTFNLWYVWPHAALQRGKSAGLDVNTEFAGKPIENGMSLKAYINQNWRIFSKHTNLLALKWLSGLSEGEQGYARKAFEAIKMRGYEFLEMARHFDENFTIIESERSKSANLDVNDKFAGKPIENGAQLKDKKVV